MNCIRQALFAYLLAATMLVPRTALAQSTWEPFDGVLKLVEWFVKMNAQFDKIVIVEKQGQLLRSVDRLRKDLYALEADTRILQDNIPDERPNAEQKHQLQKLVDELMASVGRLSRTAREIGADLRLNEGSEVEKALTYGLRTRARVLTYLQQTINESDTRPWNPQEVRARIDQGLQAVRAAQVAVTKFRQKLVSSK